MNHHRAEPFAIALSGTHITRLQIAWSDTLRGFMTPAERERLAVLAFAAICQYEAIVLASRHGRSVSSVTRDSRWIEAALVALWVWHIHLCKRELEEERAWQDHRRQRALASRATSALRPTPNCKT